MANKNLLNVKWTYITTNKLKFVVHEYESIIITKTKYYLRF